MTRGTLYYIGANKVMGSIEFNGDMYPDCDGGYGDEAMEALKGVKSAEEFKIAVDKFNEEHHDYQDYGDEIVNIMEKFFDSDNYVDFNKDYYGRFFSDWVFIKNGTINEIFFKCRDDEEDDKDKITDVVIKPGEVARFEFGRAYSG